VWGKRCSPYCFLHLLRHLIICIYSHVKKKKKRIKYRLYFIYTLLHLQIFFKFFELNFSNFYYSLIFILPLSLFTREIAIKLKSYDLVMSIFFFTHHQFHSRRWINSNHPLVVQLFSWIASRQDRSPLIRSSNPWLPFYIVHVNIALWIILIHLIIVRLILNLFGILRAGNPFDRFIPFLDLHCGLQCEHSERL